MIQLPVGDVVDYLPTLLPKASESLSALQSNLQDYTPAGRRWRFTVSLRALSDARVDLWAVLEEAGSKTFLWPLPQLDAVALDEGAPRVDGSGQLGRTLNIKGASPGYVVPVRTFVTLVSARRYVYRTSAAAIVAADGRVALPLYPNIRAVHSDNDVVEIASPQLEGRVRFDGFQYRQGGTAPARFIIEERA